MLFTLQYYNLWYLYYAFVYKKIYQVNVVEIVYVLELNIFSGWNILVHSKKTMDSSLEIPKIGRDINFIQIDDTYSIVNIYQQYDAIIILCLNDYCYYLL